MREHTMPPTELAQQRAYMPPAPPPAVPLVASRHAVARQRTTPRPRLVGSSGRAKRQGEVPCSAPQSCGRACVEPSAPLAPPILLSAHLKAADSAYAVCCSLGAASAAAAASSSAAAVWV